MLETRLTAALRNFIVLRRGSIASRTALKGHSDIDLDFILPRGFCTKEAAERICNEDTKALGQLCHKLYNEIQCVFANDSSSTGIRLLATKSEFTRSIELKLKIHGTDVDVDIFPKFICDNGNIWRLDKNRQWKSNGSLRTIPIEKVSYPDEARAAVLFIKFWKSQLKASPVLH